MEVVVTTGAVSRAKLQSKCHQQTNTQLFTGRMSFLSPNQQCQSPDLLLLLALVSVWPAYFSNDHSRLAWGPLQVRPWHLKGTVGARQAICPSCHPRYSVKASKEVHVSITSKHFTSNHHVLNPFSHLATARASDSSTRLDYVRVISTPIIIIIIIKIKCHKTSVWLRLFSR